MTKYPKKIFRRFARWMAFNPPGALTSTGWRSFNNEFHTKAPIRFWFDNNFKKIFVYPFTSKYETISDWLRYRTYNRHHVVNTGLKPGYYDTSSKMLHVNFNMLKDFVEVQQASREYWCSIDNKKSWCERFMPFYGLVKPFRRPDLGIKHLEWSTTLDDPSLPLHEQSPQQAKHSREVLALYKWWVEIRPSRVEVDVRHPTDDLSDIFDPVFRNTKKYRLYSADLKKSFKQEEMWEKEDTAMLVRLMKIRRGLWT